MQETDESTLRADTLDACFDPAPEVRKALQARPDPAEPGARELVATVAERRGLPEACVVAGAGRPALLGAALPGLVGAGDRVVVVAPTAPSWTELLAGTGAELRAVSLDAERGFPVELPRVLEALTGARMLALLNPNDPTGRPIAQGFFRAVLGEIDRDQIVLVDETAIDWLRPPVSVERWVVDHPNLVVVKALGSFYGLRDVAVGYLAMHPERSASVRPLVAPLGRNVALAACAALREHNYAVRCVKEVHFARDRFVKRLEELGLVVHESRMNYVLVDLGQRSASAVRARLAEEGVRVLDAGDDRHLRVTVQQDDANDRVAGVLERVLA